MSEARGPQFDAERTPAEGENNHGDLLAMFDRWTETLEAKRSAWRQEAEECYSFVAGTQWDPVDVAALNERGRIPVVFNLTAPTVDAVSGAEIQNRQQVQYYPREVGDTGVSDVLTQGAEYISDECNGDQEDSEAFRDCLTCGEGWTHTGPEVDGERVRLVIERIDPLQMAADPNSRKACYEDARYLRREIPMSRDEFEDFRDEIGRPDIEPDGQELGVGKRATIVDPRQRYKNGMLGSGDEDTVVVCEWQWWTKEPVHLAALPDPQNPNVVKITPIDGAALKEALAIEPGLKHTQSSRKVYYRALVGGGEVLLHEPLKENGFRYKAITGKRDRNKGTWFGIVRAMMDPQRFTNKLYSEILHIVRTNAKGGVTVEDGAVDDQVQFEESWAQADEITFVKAGALAGPNGPRILPKIAPPIPTAIFQLMEFARDMVRACTGVNEEILGLVQREQPGILEAQRKQAAYGILGPFFDALKRYRKDRGKLQLAQMREYMPADELVRIVDKGSAQYVPLAETMEAQEYDVVVDEAPAGPNQKAKISAVLQPLIPELVGAGLVGPDEVADTIEYLDIPAAVANKLADGIRKRAQAMQPDPAQQQLAQAMGQAELANKDADTEKKRADAFKTATDAHLAHAQAASDIINPPPPPTPDNSPKDRK